MFVHAKPLALFVTVALVKIALAVSPCPNGYEVVNLNGQVRCVPFAYAVGTDPSLLVCL